MDLWIRSQDGEVLTKVNMGLMYWKDINNRDCIVNKDNATGFSILGAYKTKERALEVLNEIQALIDFIICKQTLTYDAEEYMQLTYKQIKNFETNGLIYEMPKE